MLPELSNCLAVRDTNMQIVCKGSKMVIEWKNNFIWQWSKQCDNDKENESLYGPMKKTEVNYETNVNVIQTQNIETADMQKT